MHDFPGGRILIRAKKGFFLAREDGGKVSLAPAGIADTGNVYDLRGFPGGGALIRAERGIFFAREDDGKISLAPVDTADIGHAYDAHDFPGGGVLIRTLNGLFLVREEGGKVSVTPAGTADTGRMYDTGNFPNGGVLITAENGLFLAREEGGKVKVAPVDTAGIGRVHGTHDLAGGVLVRADKGFFLARQVGGEVSLAPAGTADTGQVYDARDFPGGGLLISADNGLFLAREEGGKVSLAAAGNADTGQVYRAHDLRGGWVLLSAEKGLFLAREEGGKVSVAPAGIADTGGVLDARGFPGGGVLVSAEKGFFLAREEGGKVSVAPAGIADTGDVLDARGFPGGRVLIGASNGVFLTIQAPLTGAKVDIRARKNWDGSSIDPRSNPSFLVFTIAHECARSADKLGLNVRVVAPGDQRSGKLVEHVERITPGATVAELAISSIFDKPDRWTFQVVAISGGIERQVGEAQTLNFVRGPWWERWWKILSIGFGVALALINLVLFGLARRSALAWRLATDDGWGTWGLRIATLALSHIRLAQLWILDLYFQRVRERLPEPPPFLPLPLTSIDGRMLGATDALAPPWKDRRLWVQGASGMGKTAVFRHMIERHFREHETAYAAQAKWGCIIVPFAARDFASSGEDKDDPAWVVDAVRATLSSAGLTFGSTKLLLRFLESGTIGVAVDGLNEVDRTRAIAAFSRSFSEAPMLITSQQQPGSDRFLTWRLPTDIRNFTLDLLRLYLSEHAEAVKERITASGLEPAIRSGYDVRLVIDLARGDAHHARLPSDRMGLYAAVIEAGWPDVPEGVRHEQQSATAFAAWRMVSKRKPNEDMRRLKPDADLPGALLIALADAPQNDNRPVRLVRRVGAGAFEFVHDQMHAYLAARWFAQDGFIDRADYCVSFDCLRHSRQSPEITAVLFGFGDAVEATGRVIPKETADLFHTLRRAGNRAVHEANGNHSEALSALKFARQLGIWFHLWQAARFQAGTIHSSA